MPRIPDTLRLDDPLGPEFSVRIMSVMERHRITTIGELRAQLDNLEKFRGLGGKSIREIRAFFRDYDSDASLFQTAEHQLYKLEDTISTVTALLFDVLGTLYRVALKKAVTRETRGHLKMKLLDAAAKIEQLPPYTGE